MARNRNKRLDGKVLLLNPFTCGIYKDGGTRFKIDAASGKRSKAEIDNELGDHVDAYLAGRLPPGAAFVPLRTVFGSGILVPRYYDGRWNADFDALVKRLGIKAISIGELEDKGILRVRGGHGSPSNDMRTGNIPYIKVSDIRSLRVNVNPTNLVPRVIAEKFWRGRDSGLKAWDLITPNRASVSFAKSC